MAAWLKADGAKRVIGYECQPMAYQKAKEKGRQHRFTVHPYAVIGTTKERLAIRTNSRDAEHDYWCNSTLVPSDERIAGFTYRPVKTRTFNAVIRSVQPTGIKIDIEGGEYDILLHCPIPKYVQWIVMEIHWMKSVGPYLLPYVFDRIYKAGFGMSHPTGLSIRDGRPNSFHPFSMVTLYRGESTEVRTVSLIESCREAGEQAYRDGVLPRNRIRAALFTECYSPRRK